MKRAIILLSMCFAVSFCLIAFTGCGQNEDITEEPELDADYLLGEYTQQLITDGAEQMLGSAVLGDKEGTAKVIEKEVVASNRYDDGYYIAERNLEHEFTFDEDTRVVVNKHGDLVYEDGVTFFQQDFNEKDLYNFYVMGDSIELMVYVEPTEMLY